VIFPAILSMPSACVQCSPISAARSMWACSLTASSIPTRRSASTARARLQTEARPHSPHCWPDRCPNACITRRHLAPWQMSIAEGEEMLRTKRLSSLQRQIIADDNERKRQLIAPLLEGSPQ
jgi:hypothetical protein